MSDHYLNKCKHGTVLTQCRCPGPKIVNIVPCPSTCRDAEIKATIGCGCEGHQSFDVDCRVCRAYWPELVEARLKADREKIAALEAENAKMRKALEMISRSTSMDMEAVLIAREALK